MITGYMSPLAQFVSSISPYFGTSIYSSPGGLIDEILYYTRGFDTILESSILMMSFVIASWLSINYTMDRKNDKKEIKEDVKKAISESRKVANEVKANDEKARAKQLRRDN
jgi:energy-converting hydrogenase A subunit F